MNDLRETIPLKNPIFIKHYPPYCTGFEKSDDNWEFTDEHDLLKKLKEKGYGEVGWHYSKSRPCDNGSERFALLTVKDDYTSWWVIGWIDNFDFNKLDIPILFE